MIFLRSMDKFIVRGGTPLKGNATLSGAKNVALKALVASLLTDEPIILHNIPHIRDVFFMIEVLQHLGVNVTHDDHTVKAEASARRTLTVPLDVGGRLRTSSMVIGPLLARFGQCHIPNPGGCRLGTRPIDRHIEGLQQMGAIIRYDSNDGYFHGSAKGLHGAEYTFEKNTHTGTETLLLAAVLADGQTILHNAAEEIEIDDLISLLNQMGANITRPKPRMIIIDGVKALHGAEYTIMSDRNEEVTFAIAAAVTKGDIVVHHSQHQYLKAFLDTFVAVGGSYETSRDQTRYWVDGPLHATDITTHPYPGFMTDWQAPWAVLMTQANGISTIHETVFESRFSYVKELAKMGADITFFDPVVKDPETFYNFNSHDRKEGYHQGITIHGPTKLHNAYLQINDIRAGATLVLAALTASGESAIHGVELIDRGYERIEERLQLLGGDCIRISEEEL